MACFSKVWRFDYLRFGEIFGEMPLSGRRPRGVNAFGQGSCGDRRVCFEVGNKERICVSILLGVLT